MVKLPKLFEVMLVLGLGVAELVEIVGFISNLNSFSSGFTVFFVAWSEIISALFVEAWLKTVEIVNVGISREGSPDATELPLDC